MPRWEVRVAYGQASSLVKDLVFPPHISFYLAHEIAHIALEHLAASPAIVDLEATETTVEPRDEEEHAADRYALELLTGMPEPVVLPKGGRYSARELGRVALSGSSELHLEPGTLELCFGHAT